MNLSANDLGLVFPDGRRLFEHLTLGVGDERVGIVGANGSGKSTLLRLLVGELTPTEGAIHRPAPIGYLPQSQKFDPDATVAQVLGAAVVLDAIARTLAGEGTADDVATIGDAWDTPDHVAAVLGEVGLGYLPLDRRVGAISGGEATRLALAALLMHRPRVLILDEPTNDLDAPSRQALYALVDRWSGGLIVAAHDRALLRHMDRIVELSSGTARSYGGGYDAYREQVEIERAAAERERDSANAAIRRTKREVQVVRERKAQSDARGRRTRETGSQPKLVLNAKRERSQGTAARLEATAARLAESARERLSEAKKRVEERTPIRMDLPSSGLPAGTTVVSCRNVAVGHDGGPPILSGVTFDIVGPERVAVTGPNGSGKTTLLHLVAGHLVPRAGTMRRGVPEDRIAFLDQRTAVLGEHGTVLDAFTAWHPTLELTATREALAKFGFRADAALRLVSALSGGERMRAALACVLSGPLPPRCLVLDEPTNHLDVDSIEQLEGALLGYDGAVLVSSHDATFLATIGAERHIVPNTWRATVSRARDGGESPPSDSPAFP